MTESQTPHTAPTTKAQRWKGFGAMLLFGVAQFLASPGIGIWQLSVAAMLPLAWLIGQVVLPGPRAYLKLWLGAWIGWIFMLHYLRGAHIGAAIGWPILAAYCAVYPVLFVGVTRVAVHRWKIAPWIAAPILWMGLEWIRSTLFTGFAMGLLGHSVFRVPLLLQISDLGSGYLVSGLLVLWGFLIDAIIGSVIERKSTPRFAWIAPLLVFVLSMTATLGYGVVRMSAASSDRVLDIAIVQGSVDAKFATTPEEANDYFDAIQSQYRLGTLLVRERAPQTRLILWPESKFLSADRYASDPTTLEPRFARSLEDSQIDLEAYVLHVQGVWAIDELRAFDPNANDGVRSMRERFRAFVESRPAQTIPMLTGGISIDMTTGNVYNAAFLIDSNREVIARYHKNHLVLFGETIPFGEWFPQLYALAPFDSSLRAGTRAEAIEVDDFVLMPSVCFESTVPHLLRRQLAQLVDEGKAVDALVNITDDSWFHGASGLDQHLACNVFRAVELRRPMIVAANGGLSVVVDGKGVITAEAPRSTEAQVIAQVRAETMSSWYATWLGDWPMVVCSIGVFLCLIAGYRMKSSTNPPDSDHA